MTYRALAPLIIINKNIIIVIIITTDSGHFWGHSHFDEFSILFNHSASQPNPVCIFGGNSDLNVLQHLFRELEVYLTSFPDQRWLRSSKSYSSWWVNKQYIILPSLILCLASYIIGNVYWQIPYLPIKKIPLSADSILIKPLKLWKWLKITESTEKESGNVY